VEHDPGAAIGEERVHGSGGCSLRYQAPFAHVFEQELDGLGSIPFVGADDPCRATLDPAGAVDAGERRAVVVEDAAVVVADRAPRLVERDSGQSDTAIANAAKHEAALERLALVR